MTLAHIFIIIVTIFFAVFRTGFYILLWKWLNELKNKIWKVKN